ncbi:hypothetical protein [Kordia sp.]|uniref:hypothetical protein n=1 Tax=Kordia sp. TaxID=1965332 RepID=UPI003D2CDACA
MKNHFSILFFFICSLSFACDCTAPNSALEFYNASYVFEGRTFSKIYARDFQTYIITFEITKHYKDGAKPTTLSFILDSEEEYTGKSSSCDWSVESNEEWLVYAHLGNDDLLHFDGICSNSRRIDLSPIHESDQKKLDLGNTFKIENYIYQFEYGFTYSKPITDVNSIIATSKKGDYKNNFTVIKLYINKNGELQSVSSTKEFHVIYDSIFKLPIEFVSKKNIPSNDFEKEAIEIAKKIKKWEIKYHKKTKLPVAQIRNIIFQYDKEKNKWSYELQK